MRSLSAADATAGIVDANAVTSRPARAASSERAVRQMVSPSGTGAV